MTTSKDEALEKWWAKWRKEDFTWEGLAKKPLQGWVVTENGMLCESETGRVYGQPIPEQSSPVTGRDASLMDYWRADPASGRLRDDDEMKGELVVETERIVEEDDERGAQIYDVPRHPTYHIAHLPLSYMDGTPTGKADWPDFILDGIVEPRLEAASETRWFGPSYERNIAGPDRDAQLQGGIWLKAVRHPNREKALCVCYNMALIFRYCDFTQARFKRDARFSRVAFSGGANFGGTVFNDDARFDGAAFSGDTWFDSVSFGGDAWFRGAVFRGSAWFDSAAFDRNAWFGSAAFSGGAGFISAVFSGNAEFSGAAFSGAVEFEGAVFSGDTDFGRTVFSDYVRFDGTVFTGDVWFGRAAFDGGAWFRRAVFNGDTRFVNSQFISHVYFDDAQFKGDMDFTSATFEKLASFERIVWPEKPAHWHSAFEQVLFRGNLSLLGAGFQSISAFDGAVVERGIQFDEIGEAAAKKRFKFERRAAIAAARSDGQGFLKNNPKAKNREMDAHVRAQRNARLRELERGARLLKLVFEKTANKSREQLLYRFELQARRAQRGLPVGEALFSDLYALASDYGASMIRPFLALAFLLVAFAAVFYGFAEIRSLASGNTIEDAWQAFDFSLANVFKPLSALSSDAAVQGTLSERLLTQAGYGWTTGVRALAILQSVLAIVLAFLFALAVRRRFQIS